MTATQGHMDTIRVLHVDDQLDYAEMATTFLEQESDRFDTETVAGASDGLTRLADSTFDCVISDYDMPRQNGIEFLEAIRMKYPDLPFILHTGKGSEEVASDAISAGATDYLQKESGTDQFTVLANRIETAVERTRSDRQHQRLLKAIETAREGIGIYDEDGYHITVNQAYADMYETTPDELIGEHWRMIQPDDQVEYVRTEVFASVEETGYWSGQLTGLRADGTTFTENCVLSATSAGMTVHTVQDVSDQIESEKHLNRYHALIEVLEDPVYVIDEEGRFKFVNEAFVETFGYKQAELVGKDMSMVKDDTAIEQGEDNLSRILSSDGADNAYFETEIQPKNGEPIPCEDNMTTLPYDGKYFDGSTGILRDISERKAREQELRRQNKRLDEFASVVSHDLRNPLTVAEGSLELLREDCDSEQVNKVDSALTRMDDLIENLLQLARTEERMDSTESVNLAEVVENCWQNVETADATIQIGTDETIQADRSRLAQLCENLMRNAVEHNEHDVTVTVDDLVDGFYVDDDGAGIPEDERDDVFTTGYTTVEEGTGFGLSIVSEIVEAHGWNVRLTENSEGGARFEITDVDVDAEQDGR